MKKTLFAILVALSLVGCGNQQKPTEVKCSQRRYTKSLVLYYSQTHVTEKVAKLFAEATSADLDSIVPVNPYNGSFTETIERCQKEMERDEKPQLIKPMNVDVAEYDTVYLGYPIWFGVAARPLEAWFMRYDLRGKVVIPFCTFGSGGLETSVAKLRRMAPSVTILDGFGIRSVRIDKAEEEINEFLIRSGIKPGTVEELPPFGMKRSLNDEEKAIFDAACGDYIFPLGTPVLVSSRTVKNGTEYCYVTDSKDQDGKPARSEVYVIVSNETGVGPEFTKVVR
ncbi:MAG: hypothetical protein E7077_04480 [Bacteroidales bacterium]|jgi:flavodoxin|nr:hypothetical protein [Bacteroidales bacterium]